MYAEENFEIIYQQQHIGPSLHAGFDKLQKDYMIKFLFINQYVSMPFWQLKCVYALYTIASFNIKMLYLF